MRTYLAHGIEQGRLDVFKAQPLCNILQKAMGKVPTPYGDIQVTCKESEDFKMKISSPEGTRMQQDEKS